MIFLLYYNTTGKISMNIFAFCFVIFANHYLFSHEIDHVQQNASLWGQQTAIEYENIMGTLDHCNYLIQKMNTFLHFSYFHEALKTQRTALQRCIHYDFKSPFDYDSLIEATLFNAWSIQKLSSISIAYFRLSKKYPEKKSLLLDSIVKLEYQITFAEHSTTYPKPITAWKLSIIPGAGHFYQKEYSTGLRYLVVTGGILATGSWQIWRAIDRNKPKPRLVALTNATLLFTLVLPRYWKGGRNDAWQKAENTRRQKIRIDQEKLWLELKNYNDPIHPDRLQ
jgi:hypothetical protein